MMQCQMCHIRTCITSINTVTRVTGTARGAISSCALQRTQQEPEQAAKAEIPERLHCQDLAANQQRIPRLMAIEHL